MKTLHIISDENIPGIEQLLEVLSGVEFSLKAKPGRDIGKKDLSLADILLVRSVTRVDENLLDGTSVKFVGSATAGHEHIDIEHLKEKGVRFSLASGLNANAVAEFVVSALVSLSKSRRENLFGKNIGIVGHGNVGRTLERKLKVFGSQMFFYDPFLAGKNKSFYCDWDQLCACDVISFHVPYSDSGPFPTKELMDRSFFCNIPDNCVLINTSRGGICDEQALLEKIDQSSIKTVWDVWQGEPDINKDLLARVDIASPHIAGYSVDAKLNAARFLVKEAVGYFGFGFDEAKYQQGKKQLVEIAWNDINETILEAYDPLKDSEQLKSHEGNEVAISFDLMRKDYQHRLEWQNYLVKGSSFDSAFCDRKGMLEALGFQTAFADMSNSK